MTDRELLQQALDALELWQKTCLDCGRSSEELGSATKPLQAIRTRLAQPEPKDDGYCQSCEGNRCTAKTWCVALSNPPDRKWEPLVERLYSPGGVLLSEKIKYTPDGEWQDFLPHRELVGLTETEKELLWDEAVEGREHFCSQYGNFADAIEAKLKEKNA